MKKFVVKLGLGEKTVPQKIEFGKHVRSSMTANANFTTPVPTLAELGTATTELETAFDDAIGGGLLSTATMHEKEEAFDVVITAMGKYVDSTAKGSETVILSAGMETRKVPESKLIVTKVLGLEATSAHQSILLNWEPMRENKMFMIYMRTETDPPDAFMLTAKETASKKTIGNLTSGKKYFFKVEATGTGGISGEPSDAAEAYAI